MDKIVKQAIHLLQELLRDYHPRDFEVRFWEGSVWASEPGQPAAFTWVFTHPGAVRGTFSRPNMLGLGEAYIYGDYDIEGDLKAAFRLADHLLNSRLSILRRFKLLLKLKKLPKSILPRKGRLQAQLHGTPGSRTRLRDAIRYHYDIDEEFYRLWLDDQMLYSCAYFENSSASLEVAQRNKMEYVCRKLQLRPGEALFDLGCGWGALAVYAAKTRGARVLGVTLSDKQAKYATNRIASEGLKDQITLRFGDYRDVEEFGHFDKVVSVGAVEHVANGDLPDYFKHVWRLLKPGGLFLSHGISCCPTRRLRGPSFQDRYVFPDTAVVPIGDTIMAAEAAGFEVRDVESLREHYVLTTREWLRRFEANYARIQQVTDDVTARVYRLYTTALNYFFESGVNNVHQVLLSKPHCGKTGLPLTRAGWYKNQNWGTDNEGSFDSANLAPLHAQPDGDQRKRGNS